VAAPVAAVAERTESPPLRLEFLVEADLLDPGFSWKRFVGLGGFDLWGFGSKLGIFQWDFKLGVGFARIALVILVQTSCGEFPYCLIDYWHFGGPRISRI